MTTYKQIGTGAEQCLAAAQKASKYDTGVGLDMLLIAICALAKGMQIEPDDLHEALDNAWRELNECFETGGLQ